MNFRYQSNEEIDVDATSAYRRRIYVEFIFAS